MQPLPKLPSYYINRNELLADMVKVCCTSPNILLITGDGGFGKTTLTIALCNHQSVRNKFKDHILFLSLGPQSDSPTSKLKELYFNLTGMPIENFSVSDMKRQFKKVIEYCSHNILVVIDDIWDFDDAEPIINIFDTCHIVLTSRKSNISKFGISAKIIDVKEMNVDEAINLLSYNLPAFKSNKDCKKALENLAKSAYLWPLLLFLIRGQLRHYLRSFNMNCNDAIKSVKYHLEYKGITAFDKQHSKADRSNSAKICIEATLKLLSNEELNH